MPGDRSEPRPVEQRVGEEAVGQGLWTQTGGHCGPPGDKRSLLWLDSVPHGHLGTSQAHPQSWGVALAPSPHPDQLSGAEDHVLKCVLCSVVMSAFPHSW